MYGLIDYCVDNRPDCRARYLLLKGQVLSVDANKLDEAVEYLQRAVCRMDWIGLDWICNHGHGRVDPNE